MRDDWQPGNLLASQLTDQQATYLATWPAGQPTGKLSGIADIAPAGQINARAPTRRAVELIGLRWRRGSAGERNEGARDPLSWRQVLVQSGPSDFRLARSVHASDFGSGPISTGTRAL